MYQHTWVLLFFHWSRICRLGSERESLALQAVLVGGLRYKDAAQDSKEVPFPTHSCCNPGEWGKVLQECGSCREPSYKSRKYILSRRIKAFQRWNRFCFHNIFHFSLHKTWHSLVCYKAPFFPLRTSWINSWQNCLTLCTDRSKLQPSWVLLQGHSPGSLCCRTLWVHKFPLCFCGRWVDVVQQRHQCQDPCTQLGNADV